MPPRDIIQYRQGSPASQGISNDSAAVVIATDLEHGDAKLDRVLRQNAEGADLLIYDAQYTTEEYATRRGWGHSNYAEAARAAADARVSQLLLFHHDPTHDDGQMKAVVQSASTLFENVDAARELYTITL